MIVGHISEAEVKRVCKSLGYANHTMPIFAWEAPSTQPFIWNKLRTPKELGMTDSWRNTRCPNKHALHISCNPGNIDNNNRNNKNNNDDDMMMMTMMMMMIIIIIIITFPTTDRSQMRYGQRSKLRLNISPRNTDTLTIAGLELTTFIV